MIRLLFILFFITTNAWCVPINMVGVVSDVRIDGERLSMPIQLQKKLHRVGVKRIANKGINISIGWFKQKLDPFKVYRVGNSLNVIFSEYSSWVYKAAELGYLEQKKVVHILAPPFIVGSGRFIGGVAAVCSARGYGMSYSNATLRNSKGLSRFIHSLHGFMHELLHALGAEHVEFPISIMHPDAALELDKQINAGGPRRLNILDISRNQVFRCIGK